MSNLSSQSIQDIENRLTSPRFHDFFEALDVLFILDNLSGRIKFTAAWPEAALYILGEELVIYDREGARDRARRAELEEEAEIRRGELLDVLATLEDKSVKAGALEMEFVGDLVRRLGRDCALCVYGPKIVDRFAPPPASEVASEEERPRTGGVEEAPVSATVPVAPVAMPVAPAEQVPEEAPAEQKTIVGRFVPAGKKKADRPDQA